MLWLIRSPDIWWNFECQSHRGCTCDLPPLWISVSCTQVLSLYSTMWSIVHGCCLAFYNQLCHSYCMWNKWPQNMITPGNRKAFRIPRPSWGNLPGPWLNIKMTSYQYRKSHCGDKTIWRLSYLHNGISYTSKMISLYWIRAQLPVMSYSTVHPKKYAHCSRFVVFSCGLLGVVFTHIIQGPISRMFFPL